MNTNCSFNFYYICSGYRLSQEQKMNSIKYTQFVNNFPSILLLPNFFLQDACPGENGVDVSSAPPVPKNGGIDSEPFDLVGTENSKAPSPTTTSPQHHTPLNASPQPNDVLPTDMSDTTESEPDSKITCK